ncbi:hypothetical protein AQUCO_01100514v1 [Aquilegia coerulea]|uniref:Uncharacterized protein n=1 Tax=Aquilegia coerulea TaxID=218851 RepID=A0A2G5E7I5_AQUCA|nr:hypothetical protein AQUCO_01100514v1 [Aquilegia coerulea]
MTFTIVRSSGIMVQPSEPTPSGMLNLSVIDKSRSGVNLSILFVFKHGHEAANVIKEALSKALVSYYPIAGRVKESSNGELQVACTAQGVWFVEASANCSLDSVNYFDNIHLVQNDELLPTPPPETTDTDDPFMQFQVTHFTCKGFSIGLKFNHRICDGFGLGQFLNAVGEFARGFQHPKIAPVWKREAIPAPTWMVCAPGVPKALPPPPPPPTPDYDLQHAYIDISIEQISKLKNEFVDLTGEICSTFEVVTASIWRFRTRAIDLEKHTNVTLAFGEDVRQLLDPPLPEGFYGNCFFPVVVRVSSGWLTEASNAEVVKLIKDAKARLPTEFTKWLKSDEMDDSFAYSLNYTTLIMSPWHKVGFNQVDCGWGPAVHILPVDGFNILPVAAVGFPPAPTKSIRLTTWCVNTPHLPALLHYYRDFDVTA